MVDGKISFIFFDPIFFVCQLTTILLLLDLAEETKVRLRWNLRHFLSMAEILDHCSSLGCEQPQPRYLYSEAM